MVSLLRTLITCGLSVALGAWMGAFDEGTPAPAPAVSRPPAKASTSQPVSRTPTFANGKAAVEWASHQIQRGNGDGIRWLMEGNAVLTDEQRHFVAEVLVKNYNRNDPRLIASIILNLPRSEKADRLLVDLIARWSADDAEDVLSFMETLPADRLGKYVLSNAGFGLARLPATRVAQFASRLNDESRAFLAEGLTLFTTQVGSWRNTTDALTLIKAQSHEQAISTDWNLGGTLASIAPDEFEAQLATETDEAKRQQLLGGYAWVFGINNPERAVQVDAQIAKPELREEHLQRHVMEWLKTERDAALQWLQGPEAKRLMSRAQRTAFLKTYGIEIP